MQKLMFAAAFLSLSTLGLVMACDAPADDGGTEGEGEGEGEDILEPLEGFVPGTTSPPAQKPIDEGYLSGSTVFGCSQSNGPLTLMGLPMLHLLLARRRRIR